MTISQVTNRPPVNNVDAATDLSLEETTHKMRKFSTPFSDEFIYLVQKFEEDDEREKKAEYKREEKNANVLENWENHMEKLENPELSVQRDSIKNRRQKIHKRNEKRVKIHKYCCLCRGIYKLFISCCTTKKATNSKTNPPPNFSEAERSDEALNATDLI